MRCEPKPAQAGDINQVSEVAAALNQRDQTLTTPQRGTVDTLAEWLKPLENLYFFRP